MNKHNKSTQVPKEVLKELNIIRNTVRNKTNKQWQAKFGTNISTITVEGLANLERSATKTVLSEAKVTTKAKEER